MQGINKTITCKLNTKKLEHIVVLTSHTEAQVRVINETCDMHADLFPFTASITEPKYPPQSKERSFLHTFG